MSSFQYKSLQKHLEARARFLGLIANHILRAAQDGAFDISVDDIPYEFDFLEERELIAAMLAERPEIADIAPHNYGFEVRLQEPKQEMKALTQNDLEAMHARHILWELKQPDGVCANFAGLRLNGLKFECMVFTGGSFAGAVIENCDLCEGGFDGCSFQGAVLRDVSAYNVEFGAANFTGATLTNCRFKRADLQECNFGGAVLEGCDFERANLFGADFSQAEITGCQGLEDISSGPAMTMKGV